MACIAERQMCVLDQYNEVNVNELVDEGFFVVVPGDSLVPYHCCSLRHNGGAPCVAEVHNLGEARDSDSALFMKAWLSSCYP